VILNTVLSAHFTQAFLQGLPIVCLLQDASGHSNVLKAGKAEELEKRYEKENCQKSQLAKGSPPRLRGQLRLGLPIGPRAGRLRLSYHYG